jgi:hypothetical protein
VCQANTRWATPLKINNQPKNTVATIPATGGRIMASMPATIIKTLRAMDHPSDFLTITGLWVEVALIVPP